MRTWKELSLLQKFIIGFFILIFAVLAPELMMLIDVGGIELAFTYLFVYLKPFISWLKAKYNNVTSHIKIAHIALLNSAPFRPKVFITQATFCCVAMLLTGSIVFSVGFLLPGFLVSGVMYI